MARLIFILALIACVLIIATEAMMKKDKWKIKKHHKHSGPPTAVKVMDFNSLTKSNRLGDYSSYKMEYGKETGVSWLKKNKRGKGKRGKHQGRHHKKTRKNKAFKVKKHMPWLDFLSEEDCGLTCRDHEACIKGPIDGKPLCVHVKDLKKSVKLFRKYQKKEKKAWKRFHKKHYRQMMKEDIYSVGFNKGEETFKAKWDKKNLARKKKEFLSKHKSDKEAPLIALEPAQVGDQKVCSTSDFSQMRNRMMGWFHVLHGQEKSTKMDTKPHKHSVKKQLEVYNGNHCDCLKSAMWEFGQLDGDADGQLTKTELATFGDNAMEPCIEPYIISCDNNADGLLTNDEWCCCFSHILAPCYKRLDDIKKSGEQVNFRPRCDKEGYYMSEQCEGRSQDSLTCWCVDYNGNMFENTKTHGRIDCSKYALFDYEGKKLGQ